MDENNLPAHRSSYILLPYAADSLEALHQCRRFRWLLPEAFSPGARYTENRPAPHKTSLQSLRLLMFLAIYQAVPYSEPYHTYAISLHGALRPLCLRIGLPTTEKVLYHVLYCNEPPALHPVFRLVKADFLFRQQSSNSGQCPVGRNSDVPDPDKKNAVW